MAVFHKLSDHLEAELSRLERKNRSSWLTRPEVFVVWRVTVTALVVLALGWKVVSFLISAFVQIVF